MSRVQDALEPALVDFLRAQEEEHERFRSLVQDRSKQQVGVAMVRTRNNCKQKLPLFALFVGRAEAV